MRYLSYYKEYPIYEPAEGGYYYAGNQLVKSERLSKRQCRRKFEKIWQECQVDNWDVDAFISDVLFERLVDRMEKLSQDEFYC